VSKNYKQILKVLTGNSKNIERLFNKIKDKGKESGGGGEVREVYLVQSEREFKDDEEPTARMMELASSFSVDKFSRLIGVSTDDEIICQTRTGQIHGTISIDCLSIYNRNGDLLRQMQSNINISSYQIETYTGLVLGQGSTPAFIGNDTIFVQIDSWTIQGNNHYPNSVYQAFSINGNYLKTINNTMNTTDVYRRNEINKITNNGNFISKQVSDTISKYFNDPVHEGGVSFKTNSVVSNNGHIYIITKSRDKNSGSRTGPLYIYVFDSTGNFLREFPLFSLGNNLYNNFKEDGELLIDIFRDELFVCLKMIIYVYNLEGVFLYKFNCTKKDYNAAFTTSFKVMQQSGDICICSNGNFRIYKRGVEYVQRPLEQKYKIYFYNQVQKDLEGLEGKKVLSVKFPLCVYQYYSLQPTPFAHTHPNLLTHTIYFQKPQSLKKAVQAVEEYFNGPVTKSDFQDLQSGCLFGYIEGRFASRELNWETCNYNRLCRGYFLGGNVLSGIRIGDDTELVLDITQD
jgi:hypothetical protein